MTETLPALIKALVDTGPAGALLGAFVIALFGGLIVYLLLRSVWKDQSIDARIAAFQAEMQAEITELRQRDDVWRAKADEQSAHIQRLEVQVALYREQLRRIFDQFQLLKDGRIAVTDIRIPEALL